MTHNYHAKGTWNYHYYYYYYRSWSEIYSVTRGLFSKALASLHDKRTEEKELSISEDVLLKIQRNNQVPRLIPFVAGNSASSCVLQRHSFSRAGETENTKTIFQRKLLRNKFVWRTKMLLLRWRPATPPSPPHSTMTMEDNAHQRKRRSSSRDLLCFVSLPLPELIINLAKNLCESLADTLNFFATSDPPPTFF